MTTITSDGQAAVFIAADHFIAECVGIYADRRATRPGARADPPGRAARPRLAIHVGHVPERAALAGIESSRAFIRALDGKGCAERFIRTLKEDLLWVRTFQTAGATLAPPIRGATVLKIKGRADG